MTNYLLSLRCDVECITILGTRTRQILTSHFPQPPQKSKTRPLDCYWKWANKKWWPATLSTNAKSEEEIFCDLALFWEIHHEIFCMSHARRSIFFTLYRKHSFLLCSNKWRGIQTNFCNQMGPYWGKIFICKISQNKPTLGQIFYSSFEDFVKDSSKTFKSITLLFPWVVVAKIIQVHVILW